jgi:hypothetical protein
MSEKINKEQYTQPPFPVLEIPEHELGYLSHEERLNVLIQLLKDNGLYQEDAIYSGIDGEPVREDNSFGDRNETWGVDEKRFREGARNSDKFDDWVDDPLEYANYSGELPAVAVFDRKFLQIHPDETRDGTGWKLVDTATMDQAAIAVDFLTH